MGGGRIDLLTDRERRILRLLATGHSVKSAAAEEGITENAANELLRSARRKLGTGSSREAARLLSEQEHTSQKNRDEKSVLPAPPASEQSKAWLDKGALAMIVTVLAASTAVIFAIQDGSLVPSQAEQRKEAEAVQDEPSKEGREAAARAPKVIDTVPTQGAVLAPGPFRVAITFDRPMAPESYAFVRSDEGAYPDCTGRPQLSADGRTYSIECEARQPGRYVMHFNRPPYIGFLDAETRTPAQEARLEFTVGGDLAETATGPKVVDTVPANGAVIAPGPFTLSVTFDRPMLPEHVSYVRTDEGAFPECTSRPLLSADGRTFSMECMAREPGIYVTYFNRPPYMAFRDAATQTPAEPARLQFIVQAP